MNDDPHTLSGAYALHALPEFDEGRFEEHLARCEACLIEVKGLRETAAHLGLAAAETPPPTLRARVMTGIAEIRQDPPLITPRQAHTDQAHQNQAPPLQARPLRARPPQTQSPQTRPPQSQPPGDPDAQGWSAPRRVSRRRSRPTSWRTRATALLATVATAAAAALGYLTVEANRELDQVRTQAQTIAAVLAAPDAKAVTRPVTSGGSATIVRSKSKARVVFTASGLPALPTTKVYELWLMGPSGIRPAGLLSHIPDGTVTPIVALPLANEERVGLTVEPDGGSPQPTTKPILLTKLPAT